jgi:hypothetical protein
MQQNADPETVSCSTPSSQRRPMAWAWAYRYAARSSRPMAAEYGHRTMTAPEQFCSLRSPRIALPRRSRRERPGPPRREPISLRQVFSAGTWTQPATAWMRRFGTEEEGPVVTPARSRLATSTTSAISGVVMIKLQPSPAPRQCPLSVHRMAILTAP